MLIETRVKLNEFSSGNFSRGAGKIKESAWYICKMLFFLTAIPYPTKFKIWILKAFGAKVGSGVVIKPRVNIHFPWKLEIGDFSWIGEEVFILNFEKIFIGSQVCISQRAFLCGGNHDFRKATMPYRNGPITLNDGVWIGAGAFVGPGVNIEVDSVISVFSVVTSNLPSNGIFKGNPATYFKSRWE